MFYDYTLNRLQYHRLNSGDISITVSHNFANYLGGEDLRRLISKVIPWYPRAAFALNEGGMCEISQYLAQNFQDSIFWRESVERENSIIAGALLMPENTIPADTAYPFICTEYEYQDRHVIISTPLYEMNSNLEDASQLPRISQCNVGWHMKQILLLEVEMTQEYIRSYLD